MPKLSPGFSKSPNMQEIFMIDDDHLDEKERALRIELGKRTVCAEARDDRDYQAAEDSEYARQTGDQISLLMRQERLAEARQRLAQELAKTPDELRFLNLQTLLELYDRPVGEFSAAEKYARQTMETAVNKHNPHYIQTALAHMGIIAQLQGRSQFSLMMYLASHFIDKNYVVPIQNLAGWYATHGQLAEAQTWIDRLVQVCPDWAQREDMIDFFQKDESIHNLRNYEPFINQILRKIN
jgi:hypothetical protein